MQKWDGTIKEMMVAEADELKDAAANRIMNNIYQL